MLLIKCKIYFSWYLVMDDIMAETLYYYILFCNILENKHCIVYKRKSIYAPIT